MSGEVHDAPSSASPPRPFVVLVTGASSGIGEATARRFAREVGAEVVLVARREERLRALADSLGARASFLAADLVEEHTPARIRAHVEQRYGRLDLLVNNAGAAWAGSFAECGYEQVRDTMAINFDAQVRLTEALLGLLRDSAPSAIVNVLSISGRMARPTRGAYSASKFALAGWSEALWAEERPHGVHVGMVLPGFVHTEGLPATELMAKATTRWIVTTPGKVADAIHEVGRERRPERYVPRPYALAAALRALAPGVVRRAVSMGSARL